MLHPRFFLVVVVLVWASLLGACASGTKVVSAEETAAKYQPDLPQNHSGQRAAVVVSAFDTGGDAAGTHEWRVIDAYGRKHTISWGYDTQRATGEALASQLESALARTPHFIVNVRQETFGSQQDEHALAEDGWVTENEVEKGGLVSPDLFVKATITEWSPNVKGGGGGLGGLGRVLGRWGFGGLKWDKSVSRVALDLQIVNRRQQIVATIPVEVEANSTDWTAGGIGVVSGGIVGGVLDQYSNTTMEEAIAVAIKTSVERIYHEIPRRYFSHSDDTSVAVND